VPPGREEEIPGKVREKVKGTREGGGMIEGNVQGAR